MNKSVTVWVLRTSKILYLCIYAYVRLCVYRIFVVFRLKHHLTDFHENFKNSFRDARKISTFQSSLYYRQWEALNKLFFRYQLHAMKITTFFNNINKLFKIIHFSAGGGIPKQIGSWNCFICLNRSTPRVESNSYLIG